MCKFISDKSDYIKAVLKLVIIFLVCFVTTAVLFSLTAFIISKTDIPFKFVPPLITANLAVSAALTGFVISRWHKENGAFWGVLAGLMIMISIITAAVYMDTFNISPPLLTKTFVAVVAGAIGGIIGVNIN